MRKRSAAPEPVQRKQFDHVDPESRAIRALAAQGMLSPEDARKYEHVLKENIPPAVADEAEQWKDRRRKWEKDQRGRRRRG